MGEKTNHKRYREDWVKSDEKTATTPSTNDYDEDKRTRSDVEKYNS